MESWTHRDCHGMELIDMSAIVWAARRVGPVVEPGRRPARDRAVPLRVGHGP